jgi:glucan phosphoethanolaminetransferase (alkaline phosphatase superfamily)
MIVAQIIVLSVLFILDVYLIIHHLKSLADLYTINGEKNLDIFSFHFLRVIFVWGLLILSIVYLNRASRENPCPELEKVENVYKIK